jgi:uncharacterized Ntn-hydrolase superfamily protein
MTFSIIARCRRTGRLGMGSATFSIACGRRNESVRPNVGISKSQAFYLRQVDVLALNMLQQGHVPDYIMRALEAADPDFEFRQFGIIDCAGNVVAHTGKSTKPWSGHIVGDCYATYGNVLAGPQTLQGIEVGFLRHPDAPLECRLMEALEGGRDAGGQAADGERWPERSAWIRVVDRLDCPEIDLRVDLHEAAIDELRRVFEEFKRYQAYYRERSRDPATVPLEEDFAAALG